MSAVDYTPNPVIPDRLYVHKKKKFNVEEALLAALDVTFHVRGPEDVTDVVCLRLESYMLPNDPIFSANNSLMRKRLELVRTSLTVAQAARDSHRLELLVEAQDTDIHGNLDVALGVIEAEKESVQQQQEHAVMNWCRDRGWLKEEKKQWQVLAMIQRGLTVHSSGKFLTCVHHRSQMHGFDDCLRHFTVYKKYWHRNEKPPLDELAANIQDQEADQTTDGTTVLQRYFGSL